MRRWRFFSTELHSEHQLQIYEKLSNEALHRHFCKTRVTSWRSVCRGVKVRSDKGFDVIVQLVFWTLCVGCAVVVLKILEGMEILKIIFLWGKVEALLQFLVCAVVCDNCKCAYTSGLVIYFLSNSNCRDKVFFQKWLCQL